MLTHKEELGEEWIDLSHMKRYYEQRFPGRFLKGFASVAGWNSEVKLYFRDDASFICRWPLIDDSEGNGFVVGGSVKWCGRANFAG